jgi:hypothetical protein
MSTTSNWVWLLVILVIVGVAAYFLWPNKTTPPIDTVDNSVTEVTDEVPIFPCNPDKDKCD